MRSLLLLVLLFVFFEQSFAQNSPYQNFPIYYNDTVMWKKIETMDSMIAAAKKQLIKRSNTHALVNDPSRQPGLDNLLGMTKESASVIISKYNHLDFKPDHSYPFIKEVIEITDYQRWKLPTETYIFFDSADHICRITYKITKGEIPFSDAQEIVRTLSARLGHK